MPCQCGTTTTVAADGDTIDSECGCATGSTSESTCGCGGGAPSASDQGTSLERVVMELDKRVRRLESSR